MFHSFPFSCFCQDLNSIYLVCLQLKIIIRKLKNTTYDGPAVIHVASYPKADSIYASHKHFLFCLFPVVGSTVGGTVSLYIYIFMLGSYHILYWMMVAIAVVSA